VTQIRLAGSPEEVAAAYAVRADVFVTEQGVPPDLELDELDGSADHFVAYDDERAVGAYRKAGFVEEGRLRDHAWYDGARHDELVMGVRREDWKPASP